MRYYYYFINIIYQLILRDRQSNNVINKENFPYFETTVSAFCTTRYRSYFLKYKPHGLAYHETLFSVGFNWVS